MGRGTAITVLVIVALVVVGILWWMFSRSATPVSLDLIPTAPQAPAMAVPSDSTASINDSLESIDLGALDQELQSIAQALQNL